MKRKLSFFTLLIASATFFLTSCDKEVEQTSLTVNLSKTITVKGFVYAELNNRSAGLEYAPAGTKLFFSINYNNLNPAAGAGRWVDTTQVDESGMFTIDVPVTDAGVTLNIDGESFFYDQVQPYAANSNTVKKFYTLPTTSFNISTTVNPIMEVTYNANNLQNTVEMTKLTVIVKAELDNSLAGSELVVNQKIVLHNSGWSREYTTDENGKINATIPANQNIYYTISFEYGKKVPDGVEYKTEQYKYEAKGTYLGNFATESEITIDLGGGTKVE